ncbi:MAG: UDP-N-acetylmuramoyl-L-alanine--D-glutamate ligase [Bacteriovoracaceae bacterium]|jgi:UDP-N-acetylmuramoylalanine--D-glutamate ligase|nr:UDP-N-acetylmuramoyl-L-alanine--D-glutamate ligase [Bacteriovoracaceae bacterium]
MEKKALVFGMGVSGLSALKLLMERGFCVTAISSGPTQDWKYRKEIEAYGARVVCLSEKDAMQEFPDAQFAVLSPGISRQHPLVTHFGEQKIEVISEIELGFRFFEGQAKIVAITGSNGKTTTCKLLTHLLKSCQKKVFCGGNIGDGFCEFIASEADVDVMVLELSSFQLESIRDFHPDVAVILNMTPTHMERYNHFEDYAKAKWNLASALHADDTLIYNSDSELMGHWSKFIKSKKITVGSEFVSSEYPKLGIEEFFHLKGEHSKQNLLFCLEVLTALNIDLHLNELKQSLDTFEGVGHRLERLSSGVQFEVYNDAKSTNFFSTKKAIEALLVDGAISLVLGGKLRSDSIIPSEQIEFYKASVEQILLIGESSSSYSQAFGKCDKVFVLDDLEGLSNFINEGRLQAKILLFSPAHPSFDQFKNYVDRGEQFKKMVALLGPK